MQEGKRSGLLKQYCLVFGGSQRSQLRWKSAGRSWMGGLLVCIPEGWM